ncbi:aminotransferase class V-fold PLP-dependent enzyme [Roseisolibacter sp. H3M3-2]|uniref:aminotransferase class V-fold PLP-dependent enzyme n=1 Tax=Roseisolibacter sp. H3M3-2 TaxID=3031323 RepID=UPI0023DC8F3F|nr:aminotransferase class V-fold PLP-dependent enzyme [Roseisolibacter sp. H3M3-2]MDF1503081.1 aminotransferase class V-fold PLP-dependent enzyme [Roseisolibacter sp. H3M3-2]
MTATTVETYDVEALRAAEFPWAARGESIYLNNASTGPLPQRAVDAVSDWTRRRAEPFRLRDADLFRTVATARELAARLIGAEAGEIALMVNTSYGVNLAARALPLAAGDVVLTFDREFPANVYPWMALGDRGVRLELVPTVDGLPDEDALVRALDRREVRALAVSWVQFASGYTADLARLGRLCRERGVWFFVDAIQGVGPLTLDVREVPIDLLACGAQKWLLSPWGSGFCYVRRELIARLAPDAVGWMAVRGSDDFSRLVDYDFTLRDDARRFEVATLPYQDMAGFAASLSLLHELGPARVAAHVRGLADRIVEWARARDDVRLVTPADPARRAGIVSVAPRDPAAAAARLREAGVAHSVREGAVRLSPHGYNTPDEVARALDALAG